MPMRRRLPTRSTRRSKAADVHGKCRSSDQTRTQAGRAISDFFLDRGCAYRFFRRFLLVCCPYYTLYDFRVRLSTQFSVALSDKYKSKCTKSEVRSNFMACERPRAAGLRPPATGAAHTAEQAHPTIPDPTLSIAPTGTPSATQTRPYAGIRGLSYRTLHLLLHRRRHLAHGHARP